MVGAIRTAIGVSYVHARTHWEGARAHIGWISVPLMGRRQISRVRSVGATGVLGEVALLTDRVSTLSVNSVVPDAG